MANALGIDRGNARGAHNAPLAISDRRWLALILWPNDETSLWLPDGWKSSFDNVTKATAT